MSAPKVLVSILNWNAPKNTVKTVNSVLSSDYVKYKIVLLDNNSSDDSVSFLTQSFPNIKLIKNKANLGYAGAHKIAAKIAVKEKFDFLWILNNDVTVYNFTLSEFIKASKRHPDCLLGSVSLMDDGQTILVGGGKEMINRKIDETQGYNRFFGKNFFETRIEERPVSDLEGASLLIPVNIIRRHGFMNTRFFLYGEEVDYCYKLRNLHKIDSIIIPAARIIHKASASFQLSPGLALIKKYYLIRNSLLFQKKYQKKNTLKDYRMVTYFIKYFIKHKFKVTSEEKDYGYWEKYYEKLGAFHALLGLKGKYFDPQNFM